MSGETVLPNNELPSGPDRMHDRVGIELPLEVLAHLPFHLVDLPKLEHPLSNDGPRFVGVGVVAADSRGECEG